MNKNISQLIIFSQLTAIAILITTPEKILAQPDNCYMEDANGGLIDLSNLCGGGSDNKLPNSLTSPNQSNARNFSVKIKRREQGIPVIDVTLNNTKTYEMLVDTGASGTVLTVKMAEELNLQPEGYALVQTPSSEAVALGSTTVKSIRVGNGEIRNVTVIVSPALQIGLLGQDFFAQYNLTIKQDQIEFQRR